MRFNLPKQGMRLNLRDFLRRAGYFGLQGRLAKEVSYIRRLSRTQFYPRFHLYLEETGESFSCNLHLDQKQVSYAGSHAHSGEYDDDLVNEEKNRLVELFKNYSA